VIFSTEDFPDIPFLNLWWLAGREMSVLESLCGLKTCADIKDLSPLKTVVSRKFKSLSEISAVNLTVGW